MLKNILKILLIPMACWAFFVACGECEPGKGMKADGKCEVCADGTYQHTTIEGTEYDVMAEGFTGVPCTVCDGTVVKMTTEDLEERNIGCIPTDTVVPAGSYVTMSNPASGIYDTVEECGEGQFTDEPNQKACKYCNGIVSEDRTACHEASAGSYIDESDNYNSNVCPAGMYQDEQNQTSCKGCVGGTVSVGRTQCTMP